ncbi:hypothetical protein D3C76_1018260 [compost metagenome]
MALFEARPQVLPAGIRLRPVEAGGQFQQRRIDLDLPLCTEQERPRHHQRGDQRRGRVARQADPRLAGNLAEGQRLARLHRQAPQVQFAEFADRLLEMVALAHRNAARGDQHIPFRSGQAQRIAAGRQGIGEHAVVVQFHAPAVEQRADAEAVDVVDLPGSQLLARLAQLVAAAQQADAQAPMDRYFGDPDTGQQAQLLDAQAAALAQQRGALAQFLAAQAHMAAAPYRRQDHPLAVDSAVFLGDHAVGARRQRRAGEDAYGVPRGQRIAGRIAGGDAAGQRQRATGVRQIGGAQRVAVHRAVVPGRLVLGRTQVFRQHPPQRFAQRHPLHLRRRRYPLQQCGQRFIHRAQVMARTSAAAHARLPQQRRSA